MNILIDIGHPAHVHFFRHPVRAWQQHGHTVRVTTRDIPVARRLLESFGLEYRVVSRKRTGTVGLAVELAEHAARLYPLILKWHIDVGAAIGGTFLVHAAWLARKPRLVFYDTEPAKVANRITYPFATSIITPDSYQQDLGPKHIRYCGYHELSYLHPDYFTPSPAILSKYGLSEGETFSVVRYISWEASHDIGLQPANWEQKRQLVKQLQSHGRVIIVPEGSLPADLAALAPALAPEDYHDLLYYADVCLTEGATTASEAAMLGTPSLYINPDSRGYIDELCEHELVGKACPSTDLASALHAFLAGRPPADEFRARSEAWVREKVDVAALITESVEQYAR